MMFVWAFVGENESRKNYFRALLLWMLVLVLIWVVLVFALGMSGPLQEMFRNFKAAATKT
jgi:hypothetical protein